MSLRTLLRHSARPAATTPAITGERCAYFATRKGCITSPVTTPVRAHHAERGQTSGHVTPYVWGWGPQR